MNSFTKSLTTKLNVQHFIKNSHALVPARRFSNSSTSNHRRLSSLGRRMAFTLMASGFMTAVGWQVWNTKFEGVLFAESATKTNKSPTAPSSTPKTTPLAKPKPKPSNKKKITRCDYAKVYDAIEALLYDPDYDDTSYGPIFVRLAWHAAGTYDKESGTGGCAKGTMRFEPEASFQANKGLQIARDRLETVKQKFPWISYGDLWTLAAVCAIQEMGGPIIPWRPGRQDGTAADCPPDGRLPDGTQDSPSHPREIFYRMGFNDRELTCLIGCHCLGRCHKERSDFEGPWTFSPTSFSNQFFVLLLENEWKPKKKWWGNPQFEDSATGELMMMPADITLKSEPKFRKWVEVYAKSEERFFCDFTRAFVKLIELGVDFPKNGPTFRFKRKLT